MLYILFIYDFLKLTWSSYCRFCNFSWYYIKVRGNGLSLIKIFLSTDILVNKFIVIVGLRSIVSIICVIQVECRRINCVICWWSFLLRRVGIVNDRQTIFIRCLQGYRVVCFVYTVDLNFPLLSSDGFWANHYTLAISFARSFLQVIHFPVCSLHLCCMCRLHYLT